MLEINRVIAEVTAGCFLIGSHSVSSALLSNHFGAAILNALTVAACVVILAGVGRLAGAIKAKEPITDEPVKVKRPRKKNTPAPNRK
jgi:hypothetical protein